MTVGPDDRTLLFQQILDTSRSAGKTPNLRNAESQEGEPVPGGPARTPAGWDGLGGAWWVFYCDCGLGCWPQAAT